MSHVHSGYIRFGFASLSLPDLERQILYNFKGIEDSASIKYQ